MKARLVRIGNSRGIRLPKTLLQETGLTDVVELRIVAGGLMVKPGRMSREGWAEAAREMAQHGDDAPLLSDDSGRSRFDRDEWRW